mgnify:CR=1 FL=1
MRNLYTLDFDRFRHGWEIPNLFGHLVDNTIDMQILLRRRFL